MWKFVCGWVRDSSVPEEVREKVKSKGKCEERRL